MTQQPPLPGPQTPGEGLPEIVPDQSYLRLPGQVPGQGQAPAQAPGHLPARRETDEPLVSILGDVVRTGRWEAPRKITGYALLGNLKLDLRDVIVPGETLEVSAWALMGDVRVVVPPGTHVEVKGVTVMGDGRTEADFDTQDVAPTGASLVVNVNNLMGNVRVRTMQRGVKPPMGWRWVSK